MTAAAQADASGGRFDGVDAAAPYVTALRAADLFADPAYQRDPDDKRVEAMAAGFNPRLLGVLEVSDRDNGRYALLDGQHRWLTVLRAHPQRGEAFVVCQVYDGLDVEGEARMFHQINKARKALSWWDEWRARRAAGDRKVLDIDRVLAKHQLRVHPAADQGNVRAARALEVLVDEHGGLDMLDAVLVILTSAFHRDPVALDATLLKGMALVLAVYAGDELDADRLVAQMQERTPRQIRVQAAALREIHRGQIPRLCAAVIVDLYNAGLGRKVEPFLARVPALSHRSGPRYTKQHGPSGPTALESPTSNSAGADLDPPGIDPTELAGPSDADLDRELADVVNEDPGATPVDLCICGHGSARHNSAGECEWRDGECSCLDWEPA